MHSCKNNKYYKILDSSDVGQIMQLVLGKFSFIKQDHQNVLHQCSNVQRQSVQQKKKS